MELVRDKCKLQPGIPLKPMLAKPTKSITEVLDRFDGKDFTCEYKYDGERAQIHFVAHDSPDKFATQEIEAGKSEKGIANVFSRNSEDLSKKYPDILAKLPSWVKDGTKSFVLDCESVAWDVQEKKVLPFQQLMTRKRKDVKTEDIKVKVCVFAFDLLFLNGEVCGHITIPTKSNESRHLSTNPSANDANCCILPWFLSKANSHSLVLAIRMI
jgi:DNA ligase 1